MENRYFTYEEFIAKETEKRALKRTALAIGLSVLVYFAASFATGYLLSYPTSLLLKTVTTVEMYDVVYESYIGLCYLIPMLLPIIPIVLIVKIPLRVAIPMRRVPARVAVPGVMAAFSSSVVGIIIASVLLTFFQTIGFAYDVPMPTIPSTEIGKIMYLLIISVLPAIFEEILFRGFILQSLRRFGDLYAVIISALIFALYHGNFNQLPNAFIMGVAIAFLAVRTGSLIPGMILHFINNFAATAIDIYVLQNANEVVSALVNLGYIAVYFIVGIIGIVVLLATQNGFFTLKKSDSPLTAGERIKAFFLQPVSLVGILLMFVFCFTYFVKI